MTLDNSKTMRHCPVCEYRLTQQAQCKRCGSDLSPLQIIQSQSRRHLAAALQFSIKGDQTGANLQLQAAQQLRNDELTILIKRILVQKNDRSFDKKI
jgi:primosomal protein N'